jgi:outer membrane lipoprotein-sorting protein
MKVSNMCKGLFLGLALLLATSAFAASQGPLEVKENVSLNGKQLAAGNYMLKWEGTGPNVEVTIIKGKNVVATVPARLQDVTQAPAKNASVMKINEDGSKSLSEIQFAGKKYILAMGQESAKADSGEGSK